MRKIVLLLLFLSLLCCDIFAQKSQINITAKGIHTLGVTPNGSRQSGNATQNTNISVHKATDAELAKRAVDEMAATFGDDWENYKDPNEKLMDLSGIDMMDYSAGVLPGFELSSVEAPSWTSGARLVTDQDGCQHYVTDEAVSGIYKNKTKNPPTMGSDSSSGIFVVAENFYIPNFEAFDFATAVQKLDDALLHSLDSYDLQFDPVYELQQAGLSSMLWRVDFERGIKGTKDNENLGHINSHAQYMRQYLQNMKDWISDEKGYQFEASDPLNNFTSYAQAMRLQDYLNGAADIMTVGGLTFVMPKQNGTLYRSLLSYIKMLEDLGQHTMKVKKYTIYQATSYKVQAFKSYSPALPLEFRWVVKDPTGTVVADATRSTNYVQVLFQGPGTYDVSVYQTSNVIRHNYVTGYKTEVWVLDNGDIFDGLVLYNHTTTIGGFQSEDIGPTIEELRLTDQGFIAHVSPDQASKTAIIDDQGFVHAAGSQFHTERIPTP